MNQNSELTVFTQRGIVWVLLLSQFTSIKEITGRKPETNSIEIEEKEINLQNTWTLTLSNKIYVLRENTLFFKKRL